jgi:hypothetical protein
MIRSKPAESWADDHLKFDAADLLAMPIRGSTPTRKSAIRGQFSWRFRSIRATVLLSCSNDRYFPEQDNSTKRISFRIAKYARLIRRSTLCPFTGSRTVRGRILDVHA